MAGSGVTPGPPFPHGDELRAGAAVTTCTEALTLGDNVTLLQIPGQETWVLTPDLLIISQATSGK